MIIKMPRMKLSLKFPELELGNERASSRLDLAMTVLMFISWARKTVWNSWSQMWSSEHRLKYTRNCAITCKFQAEETELSGGRQPAICAAVSENCQWEGDADDCLMSPFPSACLNIERAAPGCQRFDWQSGEWLLILEFRIQYK